MDNSPKKGSLSPPAAEIIDSTTEIPQNGDEKNPVTLGKTGTVEVVDQTDQHGTTEEKGLNVTSEEASTTDPTESEDAAKEYLTGWPFAGLTIALMASIFTAGLDMNVLSTATPKILADFKQINDVAMYHAAYGIGQMVAQPTVGKIYTFFDIKWTYALSFLIFEIGSVLCAAAPNSVTLIVGRATAGIGYAGLYAGTLLIIIDTVPLRKRPLYMSLIGMMFAAAGVVGPLLGGILTDSRRLTWRFAFWINLPIGALVVPAVLWLARVTKPVFANLPLRKKILGLDLLGAALLIPAVTLVQVGLQRGGTLFPWNNSNVWALFLVGGLCWIAFIYLQVRKGDEATIPPRLIKDPHLSSTFLYASSWAIIVPVQLLYLPFYFQTIQNTTAAQSGIRILPYCISTTLGALIAGALITLTGHYGPFFFIGSTMGATGAGLLYTLNIGSKLSAWLGYQIIAALGYGIGSYLPLLVVQNTLTLADIPTGTALVIFFQNFVGAVALTTAQNIFSRTLTTNLDKIPGIDVNALVESPTGLRESIRSSDLLELVLRAYNGALTKSFIISIVGGCTGFLASFGIKWKKMEKSK